MPEIARGGVELVDELRPLWLALRDHHGALLPGLGPVRDDDESWSMRRAQYHGWIADGDAFVLLARQAGRPVGYAFVRRSPWGDSPTWRLKRGGAHLETLSVLPEARGGGIGAALIRRLRRETADAGSLTIGAMAANDAALRFYAREGFEVMAVELRDVRRGS